MTLELGERALTALRVHRGNTAAAIADLSEAIRALNSSGLSAGRLVDAVNELRQFSEVSRSNRREG